MAQNITITATNYGKSMYGGWYMNFIINDGEDYSGEHFNTLKELKQYVVDKSVDFSKAWRLDN